MGAPLDLERIYTDHAQSLFAFLLNLTRNEADTRDLVQDLFIKLAQNTDLLAGARDRRAFLLRLAHNLAIDKFRRGGVRRKTAEKWGNETDAVFVPAVEPDEVAFREALSNAMRDLAPEQRAVLHLKLWEGLTFEQIAETLQIPVNTAASRYRYGLDKLRVRLRPIYDELT